MNIHTRSRIKVQRKEAQMNTILVPLDGSTRAEQVLPYVQRLASLLDARLYLLQVVPEIPEDEPFAVTVAESYRLDSAPTATQRRRAWSAWETQRQHALGYLGSHAVMLQAEGTRIDFEVRLGHPTEEIVTVATEQHAKLIALATHGYSGLKRWTLGSVTDKVVHATTTPVFIVRSGEPVSVDAITFNRILVPLDGSMLAKQALPFATELASAAQAELLLLQAVSPTIEGLPSIAPLSRPLPQFGQVIAELRAQADDELTALAAELRRPAMPVTRMVVTGHPAEVIVDEAQQRASDLIVMATHGYGGIRRWALGSVADKVLHAATTPLVLVRAADA
jgi:nucleotide-binding universal stress UspA family protein